MFNFSNNKPKRIVCLTEETTETLYLIGGWDLIAGITEYTVRPPHAKLEKPVLARYLDADIEEIVNLKPDIVLAWSDLQAEICKELIRKGIEVYCFNHRSVEGILSMIIKLGALTGLEINAEKLVTGLLSNIQEAKIKAAKIEIKPKVYFEEWFSPLISGIGWVSEIIEICGGLDIFSENRIHQGAKNRIIENTDEVINRNPDIILASWCGKPFRKKTLTSRKGWQNISAVRNDFIYEIDSAIILQPGPASLSDGIKIISEIIMNYSKKI